MHIKTWNLFSVLIVGLALAAMPLVGCGDSRGGRSANGDPTTETDVGDDVDEEIDAVESNDVDEEIDAVESNDVDEEIDAVESNDIDEEIDAVEPNDTNEPADVDEPVDVDDKKDVDEPTVDCAVATAFQGQIGGVRPHDGGTLSTRAYTNDAGIKAFVDSVVATGTKVHVPVVKITNATVVATSFVPHGNKTFWVQDKNGGVQAWLKTDAGDVKVGQKVSFDIVKSGEYRGNVQITELTNFVIVANSSPVYLMEKTGKKLSDADYGKMVRIGGVLSGEALCDDPDALSPNYCYTLTHGAETVSFRSKSLFIKNGSCVTYVGPVGTDFGPLANEATNPLTYQLDAINHYWLLSPL